MANGGIKGAVDALGALAEMPLVFYRTALQAGATPQEAKSMLEAYMPQSDVARRCLGKARRKPVVRYDRHGESVIYKTVSEAAKHNGLTRSSILRRMRGEVLDPRGYKFELLR